jgi:hypothetical protein
LLKFNTRVNPLNENKVKNKVPALKETICPEHVWREFLVPAALIPGKRAPGTN